MRLVCLVLLATACAAKGDAPVPTLDGPAGDAATPLHPKDGAQPAPGDAGGHSDPDQSGHGAAASHGHPGGPVEAHGKPGETHTVHGRPHHGGDHATVDHHFDDPERWSRIFDDPARDAWQKPAALVAALDLATGMTVADIGAGTGYFNPHLSKAVGDQGRVIAVDISQGLVDWMTDRARKDGTPNVEVRLGQPDDPGLKPGEADVVLLVDTYHHIGSRVDYFTRLRDAVKPGGRLVVVDFKPGALPVGPPESHRIPEAKVVAELTEAGWADAGALDVLPYQFVRVVERPAG